MLKAIRATIVDGVGRYADGDESRSRSWHAGGTLPVLAGGQLGGRAADFLRRRIIFRRYI
jgi:hypothetical protein